jgi:hypothetical protein
MISNTDITNFIVEEISTDDTINNLCVSKFGQVLLNMVGVDVNNPPSTTEFPVFITEPTQKSVSDSDSEFSYEIVTHIALEGDDKPQIIGNVIKYLGIEDIEELGNLIVEKLKNSFSCKTNMDAFSIDFYHDEIDNFPVYSGVVVISFNVPNVIGSNKLEFNL